MPRTTAAFLHRVGTVYLFQNRPDWINHFEKFRLLNGSTGGTIETWILWEDNPVSPVMGNIVMGNIYLRKATDGMNTEHMSIQVADNGQLHAKIGLRTFLLDLTSTSILLRRDSWNHIAVVLNNTKATLFINGSLAAEYLHTMPLVPVHVSTSSLTSPSSQTDLWLNTLTNFGRPGHDGTLGTGGSPFMNALIDRSFLGAMGGFRVSSIPRYTADFTPDRNLVFDNDTMLLLNADRTVLPGNYRIVPMIYGSNMGDSYNAAASCSDNGLSENGAACSGYPGTNGLSRCLDF